MGEEGEKMFASQISTENEPRVAKEQVGFEMRFPSRCSPTCFN